MLDRLFAVTWPLNYRKVIIMRFLSIVTVLTLITLRSIDDLSSIQYIISNGCQGTTLHIQIPRLIVGHGHGHGHRFE